MGGADVVEAKRNEMDSSGRAGRSPPELDPGLRAFVLIKKVPQREDDLRRMNQDPSRVEAALFRAGRLTRHGIFVVLPGAVLLVAASTVGYALAVKHDRRQEDRG